MLLVTQAPRPYRQDRIVRPDMNLGEHPVGEKVFFQVTETIAVDVTKGTRNK